MNLLTCRVCAATFESVQPHTRYCSRACRLQAQRVAYVSPVPRETRVGGTESPLLRGLSHAVEDADMVLMSAVAVSREGDAVGACLRLRDAAEMFSEVVARIRAAEAHLVGEVAPSVARCEMCGEALEAGSRPQRTTCSAACRVRMHKRRRAAA